MESSERLRLQAIISVLVEKLGGDVMITEAEINQAKDIEVNVDAAHPSIGIKVRAKNV